MPAGRYTLAGNGRCDALATTDAQSREAPVCVPSDHLVNERDQDPASRGADGMSERNRAAIHVNDVRIPLEFIAYGEELRGEGFVGFDEIELGDCPAGLLETKPSGGNGPAPHECGIHAGGGGGGDLRENLETAGAGGLFAHDQHSGGAVVQR